MHSKYVGVLTSAFLLVFIGCMTWASGSQADIGESGDPPPQSGFEKGIDVMITVQQGVTEISLKDFKLDPVSVLPQVSVGATGARQRYAFGEVRVKYFASGDFKLFVFTTDGSPATSQLGFAGMTDSSERLNFKVWTDNFGIPVDQSQLPAILPLGPVTQGKTIPDPGINSLWGSVDPDGDGPAEPGDDPDGDGPLLGAVWKLVAECDSKLESGLPWLTTLSSSEPSPIDPESTQIAPSLFSTYFAFDAASVDAQAYQGKMYFQLDNN
jgi:hypothetical protein